MSRLLGHGDVFQGDGDSLKSCLARGGDYGRLVRGGDMDSIRVYRFNNVQVLLSAGQKWARQGLTPVWPEHQTCTWTFLMVAGLATAVGPSLPSPFIPNDSRHWVTAITLEVFCRHAGPSTS